MGKKKKKQKEPLVIEKSPQVEAMIKDCLRQANILTGNAKICGLMVSPVISKNVAGRCIRTGRELNHFSGYDYIIEISKEYWDNITPETRKILVLHECMHIQVTWKKDGEPKFGIRPHDMEDFSELIEKHGVKWLREVNLVKEHLADKNSEDEIGEL